MGRFDELKENFRYVLHEEGAGAAARRLGHHAGELAGRLMHRGQPRDAMSDNADVLFINGCDYCVPHPIRYRVNHQAEQLEAVGITTLIVNAWELTEDHVRLARAFVIFRCPYADHIGAFIELAHSLNKVVLYDIDDLVIDTAYTDLIPYLATMSEAEREQYDDGVRRMGKTLSLCDGAITTTEQLSLELRKYVNPVFVNRNVASEEMLHLSERAVFERDVLPSLEREQVKAEDTHRWKLACERRDNRTGFSIGYFSGSITHNDDFEFILPAIARFMAEYPDVSLHVVGELNLPNELKPYSDRVVRLPFSPWRRLPQMLSLMDVNLAPLVDTLFNRAKSENKWVEAALVKVPTVASSVGALRDSIEDGVTGILCSSVDEWYEALVKLRSDSDLRRRIGAQAYEECRAHHVTVGTGMPLAQFIRSQLNENIGIVLPGLDVSGGVLVAFKHAKMLHDAGLDVTLIGDKIKVDGRWADVDGMRIPVVSRDKGVIRSSYDKLVATMWTTVPFCKFYFNVKQVYYLVQNLETGFYEAGKFERHEASKTYGYNPEFTYCTISPWCAQWLHDDFCKDEVRLAPNGIDLNLFKPVDRDWSGKIRILVEGDSSSEYKNVDESFSIINRLDPERYEVWYLSYRGEPKSWYRVDKFLKSVPHDEVGAIYQQCHVLLKTSVLESFSYPPLEMIATGGAAVVLANEGNAAYLKDGENCLLFNRDEDDKAAELIECVVADGGLREHLRDGGLATAQCLSWDTIRDDVLALYA